MYPQQPGWGPVQQPPKQGRSAAFYVVVGVSVIGVLSAIAISNQANMAEEEANRAEALRAQAQAVQQAQAAMTPEQRAAQAAAQQAAQQMAARAVPGVCASYGATNANSSAGNRGSIASLITDRLQTTMGTNGSARVGPTGDTLVFSNMRDCGPTLVGAISAVAGSYEASARMLCATNGFREIVCVTAGGTQQTLDFDHQCQCTDRFSCVCPRPSMF